MIAEIAELGEKGATLSNITDKIAILSDKRLTLMEAPKADRDAELLKVTEEELARAEKTEARLIAEIAELKGSLASASTATVSAGTVYISTDLNLFMIFFIYSKLCFF